MQATPTRFAWKRGLAAWLAAVLLLLPLLPAHARQAADWLYWLDAGADVIQRADLEGVNRESVVTFAGGRSAPVPFALAPRDGWLYWIDPAHNALRRARLDGTFAETLIPGGVEEAVDLVVHPRTGRLYWAAGDALYRAHADGTGRETVLRLFPDRPGPLALDPVREKLYWVRIKEEEAIVDVRIQRANLDGTDVEDVLPTGLLNPTALVVDTVRAQLYWADLGPAARGVIRRANLNGTRVETVVPETALIAPWGLALDLVHDRLYWSDNSGAAGVIRRADRADGGNIETVVPLGLGFPTRLALTVRDETPTSVSPPPEAPAPPVLSPPYPNPFTAALTFTLTPPRTGRVRVGVYDVRGREVARLFEGVLPAGVARAFTLTGERLPPGVYGLRATGVGFRAVRRVVRVR